MDRERILRRIVGPHAIGNTTMRWRFTARRQLRHGRPGHGSTQGRAFELEYNARSRTFEVKCYRYLSKKRKRIGVKVSKAMLGYLKSRLQPKHIALCTMASITVQSQPDPTPVNPRQWALGNAAFFTRPGP